jgi:hypothetical protein
VANVNEGQISEAQIAVHWREEDYYYPPARLSGYLGGDLRYSRPVLRN